MPHCTAGRRPVGPRVATTRRTPKGGCPTTAAIRALCRERASKRWSALLTQTRSRIGHRCGMRKRLGEVHWAAFVRYAEAEHKAALFSTFLPASGVLCCEGKLDGTPCPKQLRLDLRVASHAQCADTLPGLHVDHTHDVQHVCDVWSRALPAAPRAWDDGICGALVAHLLFGVEDHIVAECSPRHVWRRQLFFRCGDVVARRAPESPKSQHAGDFCHDVAGAHYEHVLRPEDLRWQAH